ncbi:hypothetical protein [Vagococcus humatus]|uniref:Uncharacterized protein n=1 Tax=Vagococcus humatus TaxID=1889241 RepID=A0A3S0GEP2_9ENTE|nr:hypothetical protein [Vagococcus humatus]RST90029.1 hypothetical protein C7P63_02830 [Vagococcus humatus]
MKLKPVLRYNLRYFFKVLIGTLIGIITLSFILPLVLQFIFYQDLSLPPIMVTNLSSSITFILWAFMFSLIMQNHYLFAQFQISRKTQFVANLLTILCVSLLAILLFNYLYPLAFSQFTQVSDHTKIISFHSDQSINLLLNALYHWLECFTTMVGAWFLASLSIRFSPIKVLLTVIGFFIVLGILIISSAGNFPDNVITTIINTAIYIYKHPNTYWLVLSSQSILLLLFTRLITKKLPA